MFSKLLKNHQSLLIGLGLFFLMMLVAFSFSFGVFGNQHQVIYALSSWFSQHKFMVILWHIFLIAAIYWGWGFKVDLAAKRTQINEKQIKKLKRFRWVLISAILLIDLFVFL